MFAGAAILKLADPFQGDLPLTSGAVWVNLVESQFELFLGVWLLLGISSRAAIVAAMLLLCGFIALNARALVLQHSSCGCLGSVTVSPSTMLVVDAVALGLAILSLKDSNGTMRSICRGVGGFVAINVAILGLWQAAITPYGTTDAAIAILRGQQAYPLQAVIDCSPTAPGQSLNVPVILCNGSDQPVRILGGSTTCNCTTLNNLPNEIPPRGRLDLEITLVAPKEAGKFRSTAIFYTNDPNAPRIHVRLRGTSVAP